MMDDQTAFNLFDNDIIYNYHDGHFDISPRFLMFVFAGAIAFGVLFLIALLMIRKVDPRMKTDASFKKSGSVASRSL